MNTIIILIKRDNEIPKSVEIPSDYTFRQLKAGLVAAWSLPPFSPNGQQINYQFINDKTGNLVTKENSPIGSQLNEGDILCFSQTEGFKEIDPSNFVDFSKVPPPKIDEKQEISSVFNLTKPDPVKPAPFSIPLASIGQITVIDIPQFQVTGVTVGGFYVGKIYPVLAIRKLKYNRKTLYLLANDKGKFCWLSSLDFKFNSV